jgi:predicted transcriptional regulator of viral defense system
MVYEDEEKILEVFAMTGKDVISTEELREGSELDNDHFGLTLSSLTKKGFIQPMSSSVGLTAKGLVYLRKKEPEGFI